MKDFLRNARVWWIERRIKQREDLIEDLKSYRDNYPDAPFASERALYILELRDRNKIDQCEIASLCLVQRAA